MNLVKTGTPSGREPRRRARPVRTGREDDLYRDPLPGDHFGGVAAHSRRVKTRHPEIPWHLIAGSGNICRHDREDVLAGILWNTVVNELDALDLAVRLELRKLKER